MNAATDLLTRLALARKGEDFLTEALAWTLNNTGFDLCFRSRVLRALNDERLADIQWGEWRTRYHLSGKFLDMVCISSDGTRAIIFEHKENARFDPEQIRTYRKISHEYFEAFIGSITPAPPPDQSVVDFSLCWYDLHEMATHWLETDARPDVDEFVVRSFLDLLDKRALGPMTPITKSDITHLWNAILVEESLVKLIRRMPDEADWMTAIPVNLRSAKLDRRSFGQGQRPPRRPDGRIGLDLLDEWHPGIFVGVLVDGRDHRIPNSSDPKKGPDFCLILDMHRNLHSSYPDDPNYRNFKKKLRKRCERTPWRFLDHLKDHKPWNPWHPIHVRQPLSDVIGNCGSGDAQIRALRDAARDVLSLIVGDRSFWNLRQGFSRQLGPINLTLSDSGGSKGVAPGSKGERAL